MRERMTPACLEDLSRHLRHLIPPSPFHMHAGEKEPQGTMKRRRKSSSPSSGSSTKFRQKSFPILMGDALKPATLLRMPEEDMPLPPHDVPIFFYKEEVIIRDDEGSDSEGMKAVGRGLVKPGQARKRRFRPRPTFRWVLEALDIKLHGNTNKIQAKDGSAYFILRVDESTRETRLVPLVETVMLRQTAPDDRGMRNAPSRGDGQPRSTSSMGTVSSSARRHGPNGMGGDWWMCWVWRRKRGRRRGMEGRGPGGWGEVGGEPGNGRTGWMRT